jgi:hypothetical protein
LAKLVIVAFPHDAAKMLFIEEDQLEVDTEETKSYMCWGSEIAVTAKTAIKDYDGEVEEILFVGPKEYITPLMIQTEQETRIKTRIA